MDAQNSNASSNDISLSHNPFIWGHIALLAGVPWLLSLSMAGLAVGDPVFPAWFEIILLGFPAIALVTWVQWQKPLLPFSLWVVAKPTESLSERDRRILTLIKQYSNGWYVTGWIAIALAVLSSVVFYKIYMSAPLAQAIAPFPNWLRFLGILWAEFFFLLSNVLLQAGLLALRVQLTPESELLSLPPFAIAKINNSFTNIAWRSPQLLKFFEDEQIILDHSINAENAKSEIAEEEENVSPLISEEIVEPITIEYSDEFQDKNGTQDFEELESNNLIAETTDISPKEEIIEQTEELDETSEFIADESFAKDFVFEVVSEISDKETLEESEEVEVLALVEEENPELEAIAEPIDLVSELKVEQLVETAEFEEILDEEIIVEEPEKLEASQFVIDGVIEGSEIDVTLNITETISAPEIIEIEKFDVEAIAETTNLDLEIDDLIKEEPEILDNNFIVSNDFDDELDELIAFNIYVENILRNYLEEPLEEVNEVESIAEIAATSELVAEIVEEVLDSEETLAKSIDPQPIFVSEPEVVIGANILINVETIADNLLAIKTEVMEEIPEFLSEEEAENEQKEPVAEVNVFAEGDVFADLEALLDDQPRSENLE